MHALSMAVTQVMKFQLLVSVKSVNTVETDQSRDHSESFLCQWPALNLGKCIGHVTQLL